MGSTGVDDLKAQWILGLRRQIQMLNSQPSLAQLVL